MPPSNPRYYFDTNALWKFYKGTDEKGSLNIRRLVSNAQEPILVSPLTILEFIDILMKHFRQGELKRGEIKKVVDRLRYDTGSTIKTRPFIVSLSEIPFKQAEGILLQYATKFGIGSNDSLHLAIVDKLQATIPTVVIVTSDNSMQHVCQKVNLAFYDPEIDDV